MASEPKIVRAEPGGSRDAARAPYPRGRADPLGRGPHDGRPGHRPVVDARGGRGHLGVAARSSTARTGSRRRTSGVPGWARPVRADARALTPGRAAAFPRPTRASPPPLPWSATPGTRALGEGGGMADLDWNHGGAAQVVAALGEAAQAIGAPAAGLGAGAPGDVGPGRRGDARRPRPRPGSATSAAARRRSARCATRSPRRTAPSRAGTPPSRSEPGRVAGATVRRSSGRCVRRRPRARRSAARRASRRSSRPSARTPAAPERVGGVEVVRDDRRHALVLDPQADGEGTAAGLGRRHPPERLHGVALRRRVRADHAGDPPAAGPGGGGEGAGGGEALRVRRRRARRRLRDRPLEDELRAQVGGVAAAGLGRRRA